MAKHNIGNWKRIHSAKIGTLRKIWRKIFKAPDGKVHHYDILREPDCVQIFALDRDMRLITILQFRPGPELVCRELPGGKLEKHEDPVSGAERELLEETGYTTDNDLIELGSWHVYSNSERLKHVFLATGCYLAENKPEPDDDEFIEVDLMPLPSSLSDFMLTFEPTTSMDSALLGFFCHHNTVGASNG